MKMKVTTIIKGLFIAQGYWSTKDIIIQLIPRNFTVEQITGGIGYLRSKGILNVHSKLPYGHIFY
jgi:hypothetical protein